MSLLLHALLAPRRTGRPLAVALAFAVALVARADRVHLDGGGTVETARWWWEGDRLLYETPVGTIGLPRSMVLRIEPTGGVALGFSTPSEPPAAEPPAAQPDPPPGTVEVPLELGRILNEARTALDGGDFEKARSLYQEGLRLADPELHLPRIGYALSLMALGEDPTALGIVLDGLNQDPDEPALLELLGDLHDRRELVQDALRAWEHAFRAAPNDRLQAKILKAERELEAARSYSFTTSAHFNLRYDGEVDAEIGQAVNDYLEESFSQLVSAWRHTPPQAITVLLYPSQEFRDVTQTPEWVGGIYDGKIRVPLGGLTKLDPAAQSVLIHELTHAVVHSKSRGQCPRWLHEGLAQRAEGRELSRAGRTYIVQQIDQGDPAAWQSHGFSYPIALSLVQFLDERGGFSTLVELVERLGEGTTVDAALDELYGMTYERLCRDWAAWFLAGEGAR